MDFDERVLDCPYAAGSSILDRNGDTDPDQPIAQRCIENPRRSRLPVPCASGVDCVCSSFFQDMADYRDSAAYVDEDGDMRLDPVYDNDADGDGEIDYFPTGYMFCSDERTDDISWCSYFDAGESFRESVDHFRRRWEEAYPSNYFRRYQTGGARGAATWGGIMNSVKIFQHFLFRYFYEPGFRSNGGVLGVDDQYVAGVDAMNWFIEILGQPDVGGYVRDAVTGQYRLAVAGETPEFTLETGQGFNVWSAYQQGHNGFFRRERAGTFIDKYYALLALARRDWSLNFTVDERFYLNFYDFFDTEIIELFGGYIQQDTRAWAPRVVTQPDGSVRLKYIDMWRTGTTTVAGRTLPARGDNDTTFTDPAIDGSSSSILRQWATMLALAEFPVFFDTTFEQRLTVYKLGNGDGWDRPATKPDGTPYCGYLEPGCTDPDFVMYNSDRLHSTYISNVIRSRSTYNLPEEQVGFRLLQRLVDRQRRIQELAAIPEASRTPAQRAELSGARTAQERDDSYLELLIEIQRMYGISSYLF